MINKLLIIVTIIRYQPGNLSFTFAGELERDIITNIGSRDKDIYEMRNTTPLCNPSAASKLLVCVYTIDSSFARERRVKRSQSPYLPEMIRFE